MRIAIVEDQAAERASIRALAERYCRERGLEAEILCFGSGESFLEAAPEGVALALLDIEMAALSGLDVARRLRERDRIVQIIFITALVQYAIDGYAVDAVDFIAKPVGFAALSAGLDRAMVRIRALTPRFLTTRYAKEPLSLRIQQIVYIESLNKKTFVHMSDGQALCSSEPLYALEERLRGEPFYRCHNAFLVNLAFVHTVGAAELTVPGQRIPVSKHRRRDFFRQLTAYRGSML